MSDDSRSEQGTRAAGMPDRGSVMTAETLYEEIGGDLCICQRADVPHWCEKCQHRIDIIEAAFVALAREREQEIAENDRAWEARMVLGNDLEAKLKAAEQQLSEAQKEIEELNGRLSRQALTIHERQESWHAMSQQLSEARQLLKRAITPLDTFADSALANEIRAVLAVDQEPPQKGSVK